MIALIGVMHFQFKFLTVSIRSKFDHTLEDKFSRSSIEPLETLLNIKIVTVEHISFSQHGNAQISPA